METLGVFKKIMACAFIMALLCILGAPLLTLFGELNINTSIAVTKSWVYA